MGRDCTCALGALFALSVSLSCPAGEPAKPESPLDQAKRLAVSEKKPERVQALGLLKALARPGNAQGDEATWRYADLCLRFHSEGEAGALGEARKAFENLDKGAGSRWGLRGTVGLLRVALAEGKRDEAIRGLDRFLGQQTKCERAVEAAYYLGCIYADRKPGDKDEADQLRLARTALGYALKLHEAVSRYNAPVVSAEEIRRKLEAVKRRLWEIEAGRLKVLFEKAENLRKAAKYDEAIKVYEEIRKEFPGHDFTELSGLRICECTFQKKDLQGAIARAKAFIAEDPLGAYRGHAHLLIGDVHLEHLFDIAHSEPEFRCVLEPEKAHPAWLQEAHGAVLARRKSENAPTPLAEKTDKTWQEVLSHAHERVGILEYIRRNFAEAAGHFDASAKLKPVEGMEREPGVGMSEVAEACRRKQMPLDESLLGQGDDRTKLLMFLGAVYMKGWKDDRAMQFLDRVYRNEFKGATASQRAYARARLGAGWLYKGESEKAVAIYKEIAKDFAETPYAADALLQHAACVSRAGKVKEAIGYLEDCYTRYPGTVWADWALYQRAFLAFNHEPAPVARKYFALFLSRYPKSTYASGASRFISLLDDRISKGKTTPEGVPLDKMEVSK